MNSNYLLYTLPQWAIFAGITVIIYGWAEKKEVFERIGLVILILLGLFAAYILLSGILIPDKYLTPEEYVLPEEYLAEDDIPLEGKLIPAYWGLVASGILAILSLLLKFIKRGRARLFMVLSGILAIGMFFLILGVIKS